jgi:hypothetical protein
VVLLTKRLEKFILTEKVSRAKIGKLRWTINHKHLNVFRIKQPKGVKLICWDNEEPNERIHVSVLIDPIDRFINFLSQWRFKEFSYAPTAWFRAKRRRARKRPNLTTVSDLMMPATRLSC